VGGDFDQVAAELGRIVRRAARHQRHQPRPVGFQVTAQLAQSGGRFLQGFRQRFRLLAGFLQHLRHGAQGQIWAIGGPAVQYRTVARLLQTVRYGNRTLLFSARRGAVADLVESDQQSR
jgi:hypothetical protein